MILDNVIEMSEKFKRLERLASSDNRHFPFPLSLSLVEHHKELRINFGTWKTFLLTRARARGR